MLSLFQVLQKMLFCLFVYFICIQWWIHPFSIIRVSRHPSVHFTCYIESIGNSMCRTAGVSNSAPPPPSEPVNSLTFSSLMYRFDPQISLGHGPRQKKKRNFPNNWITQQIRKLSNISVAAVWRIPFLFLALNNYHTGELA